MSFRPRKITSWTGITLAISVLLVSFAKEITAYTSGDAPWGNETGIFRFPQSNSTTQADTLLTETAAQGIGPAKPENAVAVRFTAPDNATITRIRFYSSDAVSSANPSWRVYLASANANEDEPIAFNFGTRGATNYLAYWNDAAAGGATNAGFWSLSSNGADFGSAVVTAGQTYWLIFSSRVPGNNGELYPSGWVGDSNHKPSKSWQKYGSSTTLRAS
jgi:hypothetical protein